MLYDESELHNRRNFKFERYKILYFYGIIAYSNDIPFDVRNQLPTFDGAKDEEKRSTTI